jgi:hypothetical protein
MAVLTTAVMECPVCEQPFEFEMRGEMRRERADAGCVIVDLETEPSAQSLIDHAECIEDDDED